MSKAEELAKNLDNVDVDGCTEWAEQQIEAAAAHLRALDASHQSLLEALEECARYGGGYTNCEQSYLPPTVRAKANDAIEKAKELS